MVTAVGMAREAGVCHRMFRRHLRRARLSWHVLNDRWSVPEGSPKHDDMRQVLAAMIAGRN